MQGNNRKKNKNKEERLCMDFIVVWHSEKYLTRFFTYKQNENNTHQ
jgi:hypothetical protein